MSIWQLLFWVAACGAVVPGPCSFSPDPRFECGSGDPCPRNFACAIVDEASGRGFCKSADIACGDGETLCEVPGLSRVGQCVRDEDFETSATHCGGCFARCRGGVRCEGGACLDEPEDGACVAARGNFDCHAGEGCVDGVCVGGVAGAGVALDACTSGADCDGGLCEEGLCTRPCDFGCPAGTTCDDDAIPGGLCVPRADSCG